MEEIKILFFALASFFGMENGKFAADITTITVFPNTKEIEIFQEGIFSIIQSEEDRTIALDQWNKLVYWKERKTSWSTEIGSFATKNATFKSVKKTIHPHLTLKYTSEKDLRAMGIWFNQEKNQFSINNIPRDNIKTKDGNLINNYWVFNGSKKFSFTVEPFLDFPKKYQMSKIYIEQLLVD